MIKVLHIITRMDMGGSAQNTLLTCLGLSGNKYEIVLVHGPSIESNMTAEEIRSVKACEKKAEKKGVIIIAVPSLMRKITPAKDIQSFYLLLKLIRRERPDIVHTHTSKAGLLGRWAAKVAGVPYIVHTPHGHIFYGHFGRVATFFFFLVEKITSLITDCIISLTEGEKEDYIKYNVCPPEKNVIIHSGVDIDLFKNTKIHIEKKKESLGLSTQGLIVGTVGWLMPIKGPLYLLEAMSLIWGKTGLNVELVYVGKGDLKTDIENLAKKNGVSDKTKLLGWRNDVHEIIPVFDIFVLPSLNEGMGRVLVEAMAAGKPVVASNAGGIPDLVKDGENGFLVKAADVNLLSLSIKKLLENANLREKMGKKGKVIAENFSTEKMIEKIDALYSMLIVPGQNSPPLMGGVGGRGKEF